MQTTENKAGHGDAVMKHTPHDLPALKWLVVLLSLALPSAIALAQSAPDLNVVMMESTFKILGDGSVGTGFLVIKPFPGNAQAGWNTLVTAAHVLESAKGDTVSLGVRVFDGTNKYAVGAVPVKIRDGARVLWTKHPEADVAAIHLSLPKGVPRYPISAALLWGDAELEKFRIQPGAELLCLGYPFGFEGPYGFPILRSGRIASYPLFPTKEIRSFLFDFRVFKGNSGGPVYCVLQNPTFDGGPHLGMSVQGIVGLVTSESSITEHTEGLFERRESVTPLSLGSVVPASYIREVVEMLPQPLIPELSSLTVKSNLESQSAEGSPGR